MYFKSNSLTKLYIPDAESYEKTTDSMYYRYQMC